MQVASFWGKAWVHSQLLNESPLLGLLITDDGDDDDGGLGQRD